MKTTTTSLSMALLLITSVRGPSTALSINPNTQQVVADAGMNLHNHNIAKNLRAQRIEDLISGIDRSQEKDARDLSAQRQAGSQGLGQGPAVFASDIDTTNIGGDLANQLAAGIGQSAGPSDVNVNNIGGDLANQAAGVVGPQNATTVNSPGNVAAAEAPGNAPPLLPAGPAPPAGEVLPGQANSGALAPPAGPPPPPGPAPPAGEAPSAGPKPPAGAVLLPLPAGPSPPTDKAPAGAIPPPPPAGQAPPAPAGSLADGARPAPPSMQQGQPALFQPIGTGDLDTTNVGGDLANQIAGGGAKPIEQAQAEATGKGAAIGVEIKETTIVEPNGQQIMTQIIQQQTRGQEGAAPPALTEAPAAPAPAPPAEAQPTQAPEKAPLSSAAEGKNATVCSIQLFLWHR